MFKNLFARKAHQPVARVDLEQLDLDLLRTLWSDDPIMQLHADRMQTALNASRAH